MFEPMKNISDWVRKQLALPPSEDPLPNVLETAMEKPNKEQGEVLYKPSSQLAEYADFVSVSNIPVTATLGAWKNYFSYSVGLSTPNPFVPDTEPFETNMMEALVGWRAWKLDLKKLALRSQNDFFSDDEKHLLRPCIPMVAECGKISQQIRQTTSFWDPAGEMPVIPEHEVPAEHCTCGIYAKDTLEEVIDAKYNGIYGQVYGWGRYVRGDQGWRAQYAYPKRFYLTRDFARAMTPETVDFLREYRVPIFVEQPTMIYNPEEDGYEYRGNEENWNFGADPESDAEEN
jgi:hypothetical protein